MQHKLARAEDRRVAGLTITRALADAVIGQPIDSLREDAFETVLDRAYELALFPLIYQLGRVTGQADHPAYRSGRHHKRWVEHRLRQTLLREHVRGVQQGLGKLEFVILKGLSLGERLYGDSAWRDSGDIDVLIRYADLPEATRRLGATGYSPKSDRPPEPWVNNEYQLCSRGLGVTVELHWALALPRVPSPSAAALLAGRVTHQSDQLGAVPVLNIEAGFLQACYHFHHHSGFLKGLFDVAAWLDRYRFELDMPAVQARGKSLGVLGIIQWPLHAIASLTGFEVPGIRRDVGWNVRMWSRLTRKAALGALGSPQTIAGDHALAFKTQDILKGHVMLWSSASMTLLDSHSARLSGILSPIFLGPTAMAQKLDKSESDLETWLRIGMRPIELITKQIRDIRSK